MAWVEAALPIGQAIVTWIDAGYPDMGPVARAGVRSQHMIVFLFLTCGTVYASVFWAFGLGFATITTLLLFAVAFAALFGFTRRNRPHAGGVVISIALFAVVAVLLFARGGLSSHSGVWLLLPPFMAFLTAGPRYGVLISLAAAVVFAGLWVADYLGMPLPSGFPDAVARWMVLVDYPASALTIAVTLGTQARIWDAVLRQLSHVNHQLKGEILVREQAEAEARESARARSTFLATMSHEIRTPLNGVLGLTDVLLDSRLDLDQRQLATTVMDSGELLRSLLDDVLDFSKIDSGRLDLEQIPMDLRALCEDIVRMWRGAAEERGLELRLDWEMNVPDWVVGDPTKVRQVLGNLVSNALKFTAAGHVAIAVSAAEHVFIRVQDTGVGLADDAATRIFEPFRQADSTTTRKYGGTGLGLAICERLTTAMQGKLTVDSVLGEGSTFTVRLPLRIAEAPTAAPTEAPTQDAADHAELPDVAGRVVLVAEDNAVNQLVIRRLLERHGLDVLMADDGEICVRMWSEHRPELILMDCQMPVCDGYAAAAAIREANGSVPIVAVTANTMPGDRARSLASGMNDHLSKPVRPEQLASVLSRWLPARAKRSA